jgi:hypothetical protein
MNIKENNHAVSNAIAAVLILAITVAIFSGIYDSVLSGPGPEEKNFLTIVGRIDNNKAIFDLRRGESLGLNTEVWLEIGGISIPPLILEQDQILSDADKDDGKWNIGERLVYDGYNLENLLVRAKILDYNTNSIVMYGTLQEGEIIKAKGGIWHFDETSGIIAEDALNTNDGTLTPHPFLGGPRWSLTDFKRGLSSLWFNGITSFVDIPGRSWSLNFHDEQQFTIEVWVKIPESINVDEYTYGDKFGYEPNITQVSEDVYAIAYRDQQDKGKVKTINISDEGNINPEVWQNNITFDDPVYWPKIIQTHNDIFLIVHAQSASQPRRVKLTTIKIDEDGVCDQNVLSSYTFSPNQIYDHKLFHISEGVSALLFRNSQDEGAIKTINVSNDGSTITDNIDIGNWVFTANDCYSPDMVRVSDDTYAIAYQTNNRNGGLCTFDILGNGSVIKTIHDSYIFEDINDVYEPDIIKITEGYFAICYRDDQGDGHLVTVEIDSSGMINGVIDTLVFEDTNDCIYPNMIHLKDNIFLIVYESDRQDGYLVAIEIEPDGYIGDNILTKEKFNEGKTIHGNEPDIVHIADDVYGIAFRAGSNDPTPHQGHFITNRYYSGNPNSNPGNSGVIIKPGVYSLFVNNSLIAATVGNSQCEIQIESTSNWIKNEWNNIAVTYDGTRGAQSEIILYLNGNFENNTTCLEILPDEEYNDYPLWFGKYYFGFIDEIAIFNRVLSPDDIENLYQSPDYIDYVLIS